MQSVVTPQGTGSCMLESNRQHEDGLRIEERLDLSTQNEDPPLKQMTRLYLRLSKTPTVGDNEGGAGRIRRTI